MIANQMMLTGARTLEHRTAELKTDKSSVLVKVAAWGICNSEIGDWMGHAPKYPCTIGHEWAGTAVEVGSDVKHIREGDHVTGLGAVGLSDYLVAPGHKCFRLSLFTDPTYALCEPLRCVVTVVRATAPELGDVGVVLGCGPMGLWCVQAMAGNMLSALIAVDVDEAKLTLARRFGATHAVNPKLADVRAAIDSISGGRGADFVIEGTGGAQMLNQAVEWLKNRRGRLTLMSMYKTPAPDFDFRQVMNKCAEIKGVFPNFAHSELEDMQRSVDLLERGTFNVKDLVSHRYTLEDSAAGYNACETKPGGYIKGIIIP